MWKNEGSKKVSVLSVRSCQIRELSIRLSEINWQYFRGKIVTFSRKIPRDVQSSKSFAGWSPIAEKHRASSYSAQVIEIPANCLLLEFYFLVMVRRSIN